MARPSSPTPSSPPTPTWVVKPLAPCLGWRLRACAAAALHSVAQHQLKQQLQAHGHASPHAQVLSPGVLSPRAAAIGKSPASLHVLNCQLELVQAEVKVRRLCVLVHTCVCMHATQGHVMARRVARAQRKAQSKRPTTRCTRCALHTPCARCL